MFYLCHFFGGDLSVWRYATHLCQRNDIHNNRNIYMWKLKQWNKEQKKTTRWSGEWEENKEMMSPLLERKRERVRGTKARFYCVICKMWMCQSLFYFSCIIEDSFYFVFKTIFFVLCMNVKGQRNFLKSIFAWQTVMAFIYFL